jgi:hypothetical protein
MAETFEAYRNRVLSYLGDEEPSVSNKLPHRSSSVDCAMSRPRS